jgi:lipoprotein NlpD
MKRLIEFYRKHKFNLVVVPDGYTARVKPRTVSFRKVVLFGSAYTLLLMLLLVLIMIFSPVKYLIFGEEVMSNVESHKAVKELNEKVDGLLKEIEALRIYNQNLQDAIMLGDSSMIRQDVGDSGINDEGENIGGDLWKGVQLFLAEFGILQDPLYFVRPVTGYVSQKFNPSKGHFGIDYAVEEGTPVYAAANGYVVFSDYTINDGYVLILAHEGSYITIYKHCSSLLKKQRETVTQGEAIAISGNSGTMTTGPHLHFEIWKDGRAINPETLIMK